MVGPSQLRFSAGHIYIRPVGQETVLGLTDFGQEHTSRVTTVELPAVGDTVHQGEPFGTIEAIKAVIELDAPVSGTVVAVNDRIRSEPWHINTDPYGEGWLVRVRLADPTELDDLMDEETYTATATWNPDEE